MTDIDTTRHDIDSDVSIGFSQERVTGGSLR